MWNLDQYRLSQKPRRGRLAFYSHNKFRFELGWLPCALFVPIKWSQVKTTGRCRIWCRCISMKKPPNLSYHWQMELKKYINVQIHKYSKVDSSFFWFLNAFNATFGVLFCFVLLLFMLLFLLFLFCILYFLFLSLSSVLDWNMDETKVFYRYHWTFHLVRQILRSVQMAKKLRNNDTQRYRSTEVTQIEPSSAIIK